MSVATFKTIHVELSLFEQIFFSFQEHTWPGGYGRLAVCSGGKRWQLQSELHWEVQPAQQQMGRSLLHVHAAQQRGRGGAGASQLPATLVAHPLGFLHQPLTRGHRLADLSLCCYSPGWIWEETQLLSLTTGGGGDRSGQVEGRRGEEEEVMTEAPGLIYLSCYELVAPLVKNAPPGFKNV